MDDEVMAPGDSEKVFWGPDPGNLILFPWAFRNSPTPTLLVHDACWQVLLDRVLYGTNPSKYTAYLIAQTFYPVTQRMEASGNARFYHRNSFQEQSRCRAFKI